VRIAAKTAVLTDKIEMGEARTGTFFANSLAQEVFSVIEVNLMKPAAAAYSTFFARHRATICAMLLVCAMVSLAMGHRLSIAHSAPATAPAETPTVQTAQAPSSPSQG